MIQDRHEHEEALRLRYGNIWYHGSPQRLTELVPDSTVTRVEELARAFSHKPSRVEWTVSADHDTRLRSVAISHNGTVDGFLYRVQVDDPQEDVRPHPTSVMAPGDEMLTCRVLKLILLCPTKAARDQEQLIEETM